MRNKKSLKLYIIIYFLINFFGLIILEGDKIVYLQTIFLFYFICKAKFHSLYEKLILGYLFFILCSCIYAHMYNDQNVLKSYVYSYKYIGIASFFILLYIKPTHQQTINIIKNISIVFCCCYIIQWLIYPITIFSGAADELNITENQFRMRMPGSISAYCLLFYGINQLIKGKKMINILYIILGFIPIIIMGFRSLTTLTLIGAILMVGFITKKIWKTIFIIIMSGIILYGVSSYVPFVNQKIEEMSERQNSDQTFLNQDYVRWIEYEHFTEKVFTKHGERFWGGGSPHNQHSKYYKQINNAANSYLYWADLGIIGLSFIIGIPAIVLLSFLFFKTILACKFPDLQFIRFTLLTIFLGSVITSAELYRSGNLILIGLYIYSIYSYPTTSLQKYENRNNNFPSSK